MNLRRLFLFAARDGWGARKSYFWPVICLVVATFSFHVLHHITLQVEQTVRAQSQELSGADLDLTSSVKLNDEQVGHVAQELSRDHNPAVATAQTIEFLSMVMPIKKTADGTFIEQGHARLTEVHAIAGAFPLYGSFKQQPVAALDSTALKISLPADLHHLLGTNFVRVGKNTYSVAADITSEPGGDLSPFPIAPHVWLNETDLKNSGLLEAGSRIRYRNLYKLDRIPTADFVAQLKKDLKDERVQIHTALTSSTQIEKLFDRVFRFTRLSSLLAVTLSLLACSVGLRLVWQEQARTLTTLNVLGLTLSEVRTWKLVQINLLIGVSVFIGWLSAFAFAPNVTSLLQSQFNVTLSERLPVLQEIFLTTCFMILIASLVILQNRQDARPLRSNPWKLGAAAATLGTTILLIQDWRWGIGFWLSVIAILFIFQLLIRGFLVLIDRVFIPRFAPLPAAIKVRLLSLIRFPSVTAEGVSGIGLGLFLVFGILIFRDSLTNELKTSKSNSTPTLFMIDVGSDQKEPLDFLLKNEKVEIRWSRFVKARLISVNGISPLDVPDEERLHREFNLNDREQLDPAEKLTAGHWWSGRWSGSGNGPENSLGTGRAAENPPLLESSVEVDFAKRMGLHLGDHVLFDLQGVTFETIVTSLRKVDWTTFHPNFYFLLQPGFLDSAPQTWIGALSQTSGTKKSPLELQDKIVQAAPNVTVIDIGQTLSRVKTLMASIEFVITFLAGLIVLAGVLLLVSSLMELARLRRNETALLKALGADLKSLTRANQIESLMWALLVVTVSVPIAMLVMTILITTVFQGDAALFTPLQFQVLGGFVIMVLALTAGIQSQTRGESANQLLRSQT